MWRCDPVPLRPPCGAAPEVGRADQENPMSSFIAALVLAVSPADDAAAKELVALTQKLKDAESYTFEYLPTARPAGPAAKPNSEGAAPKGEADDDKDPVAWKVEIQKKSPWHYQHGEIELYRHQMQFAMKGKEGKWSRIGVAPAKPGGPGSSAGGAPPKGKDDGDGDGDDGKRTGGGEKGGKGGRRGAQRLAQAAEAIPLVHQLFHDFDKKVSGVAKDVQPAADGTVVYVATLTPAAARELTNEGRPLRLGRGDGRAPGKAGDDDKKVVSAAPVERAGETAATLRIGVKDGAISTVAIEKTTHSGGGEHKSGGSITLSSVNATKIVVPPEAQALLAGSPQAREGGGPDKK